MNEDKLIEQLNNLGKIRPSDDFTEKLKGVILSTPRSQKRIWNVAQGITNLRLSIKEGFGFALSVGLVAVLIVLFFDATPQTLSPIVGTANPGANSVSVLNEANAAVKDIDIHLAEVNTFNTAAEQTGTALSNINPASLSNNGGSMTDTFSTSSNASQIDNIWTSYQNN